MPEFVGMLELLDRKLQKHLLMHFETFTEDAWCTVQTLQQSWSGLQYCLCQDHRVPTSWSQTPVIAKWALYSLNSSKQDQTSKLPIG